MQVVERVVLVAHVVYAAPGHGAFVPVDGGRENVEVNFQCLV